MSKRNLAIRACGFLALGFFTAVLAQPAIAQPAQTLEQRKAIYAPWSPDQMAQRRKQQGLVGPGTTRAVPPPAFPSYLKKAELRGRVDAAGARRRAPDRRTHTAWPRAAGKTVLIVVGEIREPKPNFMVQEAITRAMKERGANAVVVTTWDLLGVTEKDYLAVREAVRESTIGDGQRELEYFFTVTGLMPKPEQGREWVRQKDPELYAATWPEPKIADERLAALAKDYTARMPKALIAYLDKHPEIDWIVWRSGGRRQHPQAARTARR